MQECFFIFFVKKYFKKYIYTKDIKIFTDNNITKKEKVDMFECEKMLATNLEMFLMSLADEVVIGLKERLLNGVLVTDLA